MKHNLFITRKIKSRQLKRFMCKRCSNIIDAKNKDKAHELMGVCFN